MIFAVFDGNVHQLGVFRLFGRSENEGGICSGILWLVLSNGSKVARVTDNRSANGFQLFKRASHDSVILWRFVVCYDGRC